MNNSKTNIDSHRVLINNEVISTLQISADEVKNHLDKLQRILGNRFFQIVPEKIDSTATLRWLIELGQCLHKLENCGGFQRHLRTYTKKQKESSYFVSVIASHLLEQNCEIILEPILSGTNKTPDILVNFGGQQILIECKQLRDFKFDFSTEHTKMQKILASYIEKPCQIDIWYKKSFSETELCSIGHTLQERLRTITGSGKLISNENLEVLVTTKSIKVKDAMPKITVVMSGISSDRINTSTSPWNVFMSPNGVTISIHGPTVDYSKFIKYQISQSRKQTPSNYAYVLLIDGRNILGTLKDNLRTLETAFQPTTNTRFSAAGFVTNNPDLRKVFAPVFHVVLNPFAKQPISRDFHNLLAINKQ